jgi:RNA polymerase sigma factor (TIGR02999 family)
MSELTEILDRAGKGDPQAGEHLAVMLYDELRSLARHAMAGERADHTLQPTALVHEAYLRLVGGEGARFENRAHFFAAAATAIRRVLVEHSRRRARLKRGEGRGRVGLDGIDPAVPASDEDLLAVEEALQKLAVFSPQGARLVELRYFAGMTIPEVAQVLDVSEAKIERDWRLARAWLKNELEERHGP